MHHESTVSDVPCVSSGELIFATLLVEVNCPGSQEDLVSNQEPVHSLVEDAVSGAKLTPSPLALAVTRLPLCFRQGEGPVRSLWYMQLSSAICSVLCSVSKPGCASELFGGRQGAGEVLSLSLSFFLSGYPTVWVPISC